MLLAFLMVISFGSGRAAGAAPRSLPAGPLYGVTVDDISNVSQVVASESALPVMPTTRVYLDVHEPASYYRSALSLLDQHSYVMGEILDSSDMTSVTPTSEKRRVSALLGTLGSSVDVWEIGNEVNGNWTGPYSTGAKMVTNTYSQVSAAGGRTALTLYYNIGCGDGPSELDPITYSKDYLPATVRQGLNYVLLSYYQTECQNQVLTASTVTAYVQQLHSVFPNAMLGFGEIGIPNPVTASTESSAVSIIGHYYPMAVNVPYYVGGYFYWTYDEDALPYMGNPVWLAIEAGMTGEKAALGTTSPSY